MQKIHIIGGGTVNYVRPHLAICAPAYGKVVGDLFDALQFLGTDALVHLYTTKMAGNRHTIWQERSGSEDVAPLNLETNADVASLLEAIISKPEPCIVFLPAALCDFEVGSVFADVFGKNMPSAVGKDLPRLSSSGQHELTLKPAAKVLGAVRKTRKDIFLVAFKTTTGATKEAQFGAGLKLLKQASCNLVLANDLVTRVNMVVTPEQAPYYVSTNRQATLRSLCMMALVRAKGHFTRSTVEDDYLVDWAGNPRIPGSLRTVVDHCVRRGAYKPFLGKTVGHFAFKESEGHFLTSRRGVNFNDVHGLDLTEVRTDGDDHVIAKGAKPSVGGQSQRIIFAEHPDVDCIVHFHCPLRPQHGRVHVDGPIALRSQEPYECGSHECGKNTSDGLKVFEVYNGNCRFPVKAVMLDKHGPNIVFNQNTDPQAVIQFIEKYWDLERSTSEVL